MLTGRFGSRGTLLPASHAGGFELTATAEGMLVHMRSAAMQGRVEATRPIARCRCLAGY